LAYFIALVLAVGFGLPIAILSAAMAQAKAASTALEGIARQPEAAGRIQTAMILSLAFIESLVLFALVVLLLLLPRLPDTALVLKKIAGG